MMNPNNKQTVYHIAVPSPLRRLFDYLSPVAQNEVSDSKILRPGTRVFVPFGRRKVVGIIVTIDNTSDLPLSRLKPIASIIDNEPLIPQYLFRLYVWAANYYQHPIGDALFHSFPALLRKGEDLPVQAIKHWRITEQGQKFSLEQLSRAPRQQEILALFHLEEVISQNDLRRRKISSPALKQLAEKDLIALTDVSEKVSKAYGKNDLLAEQPLDLYLEQKEALSSIESTSFNPYLLFGETGSGKTEVYLQAIEKVVRCGKQALVLIPEINLTPQTFDRFKQRFNCHIAVLHSGLTDKEKGLAWDAARTGKASIVLGTRSAIFTPLKSPGLLIVDEEHDGSYKQQEGYRYSARDLAVIRAQKESIPLILGSATPSLESLYNCEKNRYAKLVLSRRPGKASAPCWIPVDIRKSKLTNGYSRELIGAITQALSEGDQVLIFLNRRGFAPTLTCHECGWISNCSSCEARLTVHRIPNRLVCHHCERMSPIPSKCPFCHSSQLECIGQGTERSEDILKVLFPNTLILRVDRDTTRRKLAMKEVLAQINQGNPCILIGTQMLAKGHHFPNVTLVGILDADGGLFSPDFRAPERMGQLITQVAGRSGRGEKPGTVILQSLYCDHPFISSLISNDYEGFSEEICKERKLAQLPPYRYMVLIRSEATSNAAAVDFLKYFRQCAESLPPKNTEVNYLGPLPATMERRNGRFRHILSIYCADRRELQGLIKRLCLKVENSSLARRVRWSVDVDPQDIS
ncbi:MAG: primosomal protein N' (replication factor Y) [Porticoccus sp.]|jgi:primosomal protein N' (replication factor Y)